MYQALLSSITDSAYRSHSWLRMWRAPPSGQLAIPATKASSTMRSMRLRGLQHVILNGVEGVERRHLLRLGPEFVVSPWTAGTAPDPRTSELACRGWNRLPCSSPSCRLSRIVCMIVSAAVLFGDAVAGEVRW